MVVGMCGGATVHDVHGDSATDREGSCGLSDKWSKVFIEWGETYPAADRLSADGKFILITKIIKKAINYICILYLYISLKTSKLNSTHQ